MQELSLGIDLLETERIEKAIHRYGGRFLEKVFTQKEQESIPRANSLLYYALGFSFKEAIWKALPEAIQKVTYFKDIEIFWEKRNPWVKIKDSSPTYWLSYSRTRKFVVAMALRKGKE